MAAMPAIATRRRDAALDPRDQGCAGACRCPHFAGPADRPGLWGRGARRPKRGGDWPEGRAAALGPVLRVQGGGSGVCGAGSGAGEGVLRSASEAASPPVFLIGAALPRRVQAISWGSERWSGRSLPLWPGEAPCAQNGPAKSRGRGLAQQIATMGGYLVEFRWALSRKGHGRLSCRIARV